MSDKPKQSTGGGEKKQAAPTPPPKATDIPGGKTEHISHGQKPQTTGRVREVKTFDKKQEG